MFVFISEAFIRAILCLVLFQITEEYVVINGQNIEPA